MYTYAHKLTIMTSSLLSDWYLNEQTMIRSFKNTRENIYSRHTFAYVANWFKDLSSRIEKRKKMSCWVWTILFNVFKWQKVEVCACNWGSSTYVKWIFHQLIWWNENAIRPLKDILCLHIKYVCMCLCMPLLMVVSTCCLLIWSYLR
jgi:hypothetical protein